MAALRMLPRDRLIGGLVGLVLGDALGVPVEFSDRGSLAIDPVRGMRGFGTHQQPAGTWSDDGALALAHAEAFADHGWEPHRHLEAFVAWQDQGRWSARGDVFDIGFATRKALRRFKRGRPLAEVGSAGERDNGNGSLMRILPASLWWAAAPPAEAAIRVGEASALTHAHPRSRLCCGLHALVAAELMAGRRMQEALPAAGRLLAPLVPEEERAAFAPLLEAWCLALPREAVPSDGYVVHTLVAACWCLHRHEGFAEALLEAVNLGGDTDTTAAVVGGLAGLRCGFSGLPREWTAVLPRGARVLALAERFADACLARGRGRPPP